MYFPWGCQYNSTGETIAQLARWFNLKATSRRTRSGFRLDSKAMCRTEARSCCSAARTVDDGAWWAAHGAVAASLATVTINGRTIESVLCALLQRKC